MPYWTNLLLQNIMSVPRNLASVVESTAIAQSTADGLRLFLWKYITKVDDLQQAGNLNFFECPMQIGRGTEFYFLIMRQFHSVSTNRSVDTDNAIYLHNTGASRIKCNKPGKV